MGFLLPRVSKAKKILQRSFSNASQAASSPHVEDVPKGYLAVYVGDKSEMIKRFVIPVTYLNRPLFQDLLSQVEREFGFDHPMGGLTIPCSGEAFLDLLSCLDA